MLPSLLTDLNADDEIIISDDGSSDESPDTLRAASYNDARVRFLQSTPSRSVSRTRNRGLRAATGDWVCFLDGDDRYLPGRRAVLAEGFRLQPTPRVIFTDYVWEQVESGSLSEDSVLVLRGMLSRLLQGYDRRSGSWFALHDDLFVRISAELGTPTHLAACTFHRLSLLDAQIAFDVRLAVAEDTDFLLRAVANGGVYFNPEPTFVYRRSGDGLDSRKDEVALLSRLFCACSLTLHPLFTADSVFATHVRRRIAAVEGDLAYVYRHQGAYRRSIRHALRSFSMYPNSLAFLETIKSSFSGLLPVKPKT